MDFSPSPGLCLLSFSKILRASASPLGWTPEEEESEQHMPFFAPSICELLKEASFAFFLLCPVLPI